MLLSINLFKYYFRQLKLNENLLYNKLLFVALEMHLNSTSKNLDEMNKCSGIPIFGTKLQYTVPEFIYSMIKTMLSKKRLAFKILFMYIIAITKVIRENFENKTRHKFMIFFNNLLLLLNMKTRRFLEDMVSITNFTGTVYS